MNNLYYFKSIDNRSVYVAEKTWKKARNTAISEGFFSGIKYITQISGYKIEGNTSLKQGIVSIDDILNSGICWWYCENDNCNSNHFMTINGGQSYRCLECGYEGRIPEYKPSIINIK